MQNTFQKKDRESKEFSSLVTQWLKKLSMGNFILSNGYRNSHPDPLEQMKFFFPFLNIEDLVSKKLIKVLRVGIVKDNARYNDGTF